MYAKMISQALGFNSRCNEVFRCDSRTKREIIHRLTPFCLGGNHSMRFKVKRGVFRTSRPHLELFRFFNSPDLASWPSEGALDSPRIVGATCLVLECSAE